MRSNESDLTTRAVRPGSSAFAYESQESMTTYQFLIRFVSHLGATHVSIVIYSEISSSMVRWYWAYAYAAAAHRFLEGLRVSSWNVYRNQGSGWIVRESHASVSTSGLS